MSEQPTIRTPFGPVAGTTVETAHGPVHRFLGIPYATGARFFRPQPPPRWTGTRAADRFGPVAPQIEPALTMDEAGCRNLNIWTPARTGAGRPVMVWIHGGAYQSGSNAHSLTDGAILAAKYGVTVVAINYRLGALGFLYLEHLLGPDYADSANAALLDIIAALRWVQRAAASFGGDANRVTIFGQSAGAAAVGTLLGMPQTEGLFRRAIMQSGTASRARDIEFGIRRTDELLRLLGVSAKALVDIPVEKLLAAQQQLVDRRSAGHPKPDVTFQPTIDGRQLSSVPVEAVAAGSHAGTDIVVGTNLDEGASWVPWNSDVPSARDYLRRMMAPGAAERYEAALTGLLGSPPTGAQLLAAYLADQIYRQPSSRLLAARRGATGRTYGYLFTWGNPATHSLEVPFVFGSIDHPDARESVGTAPPQRLSDALGAYWTAFAAAGNPSMAGLPAWREYGPDREVMIVDEAITMESDPRAELRRIWE